MKKAFSVVSALLLTVLLTSCLTLLEAVSGDGDNFGPKQAKAVNVTYKEIPYSELESAISNVTEHGHGFVVEAYFINTNAPDEGVYRIAETQNGTPSQRIYAHNGEYDRYLSYVELHQFETYNEQTYKRIDKTKKYRIYLGIYNYNNQN